MPGLTVLKIKHAKPGFHGDGRGLYLLVRPSGGRFWILRIQNQNRRRDFGLGSARDVSLEDARHAAQEMRRRIKTGIDAIENLMGPKEKQRVRRSVPSFERAARECYDAIKEGWKDRRRNVWLKSLEHHVFPTMGETPVDQVGSAAVRDVLAPIWLKIPDTGRRVLQRISAVLDFAHIKGWRKEETSLRSVRKGLPRQPRKTNHYMAMPYSDTPDFLQKVARKTTTAGRDALLFTIYTAARSGETRFASWPEFNLQKAVWSIPAERMKAGEAHVVPLSEPVLEILRRRWSGRMNDEAFVFSADGEKPVSDMTITKVLRDAGIPDYTVHGFRSTFTDWAAEQTDFPKEVVDKALAHKIPNQVEAAYRRTDFFDKRRELLDRWAMFLKVERTTTARAGRDPELLEAA